MDMIHGRNIVMAGMGEFNRCGVRVVRDEILQHTLCEGIKLLVKSDGHKPLHEDLSLDDMHSTHDDLGQNRFFSSLLGEEIVSLASCGVLTLGRAEYPYLSLELFEDTVTLAEGGQVELMMRADVPMSLELELIVSTIASQVAGEAPLLKQYLRDRRQLLRDFNEACAKDARSVLA